MNSTLNPVDTEPAGTAFLCEMTSAGPMSMKRFLSPQGSMNAPAAAKRSRRASENTPPAFARNSGFEFTERGIAAHAPRESGVYGIFNGERWIYVGETADIEAQLYAHLRGESEQSCWIRTQYACYFAFELWDESARALRKKALSAELDPVCNGI